MSEVPIVWQGRRARAFVPDLLADRDLELDAATAARVATATAELGHGAASLPEDFAPLARLLLRAEGVASSFIEGVRAPVVDVVLAESAGGQTPAAWVAANLAAVDEAIEHASGEDPLTAEVLLSWHRTLMTGSPTPARHAGAFREEQGWIGGTSPLDAHLVTPPPQDVDRLVADLVAYANRADVEPVAQAAIAHAQLELIHPFADGNGRIGRVLVGWLLTRRLALLTPPPVSTTIAADVGGYTSGLTLFRLGDHGAWVRWFATAVSGAGQAQQALVRQVAVIQGGWRAALTGTRSDAIAWQVLELLPRRLVLTSPVVVAELGVTPKAAVAALDLLSELGVLQEHGTVTPTGPGRPAGLYVSVELLALAGSNPLR